MENRYKLLAAGILAIVVVIGILFGAYVAAYAYSASKVEIRDVKVTGLSDIDLEGAQLDGTIELYNGGIVSVSIERIDYRFILEGKDDELVRGSITGGDIPAKESVNYTVKNRIKWAPTAQMALELLTSEKTTAKIEGNVLLKRTWFVDIAIPFEKEIDLTNYLNQFINEQLGEGLPNDLIEKGKQILSGLGII